MNELYKQICGFHGSCSSFSLILVYRHLYIGLCRICNKSESYVDALQRLDTQCFGILCVKSGLNRDKW